MKRSWLPCALVFVTLLLAAVPAAASAPEPVPPAAQVVTARRVYLSINDPSDKSAWIEAGCFDMDGKPAITAGKDGVMKGECYNDMMDGPFHTIESGTFLGTLDAASQSVSFAFTMEFNWTFEGRVAKYDELIGTYRTTGRIFLSGSGKGSLTGPDEASGKIDLTASCEMNEEVLSGEEPYGLEGECWTEYGPPVKRSVSNSITLPVDFELMMADLPVRTPVILLPGVAGSELLDGKFEESMLWPFAPVSSRAELALEPDGVTAVPLDKPYTVQTGRILSNPPTNVYGATINALTGQGYTPGLDLITFPYDFRLSNESHYAKLDQVIESAMTVTEVPKVVLVAHSMGGLIARGYVLSSPERASHVASIVTLGTPYWGSAKAYYAIMNGYQFGNPSVRQELMKILAANWPAAYQLLPRRPFLIDKNSKRFFNLDDSYTVRFKWFNSAGPRWWMPLYDSYEPTVENTAQFNPDLVKRAAEFYAPAGEPDAPTPLPEDVEQYAILGTGVRTLNYYIVEDWQPELSETYLEMANGRKVVMTPWFGDGDGTVPHWGADPGTATATYYVTHRPQVSAAHGDLPSNPIALEILVNILNGEPPDPAEYPQMMVGELAETEGGKLSFITGMGYSVNFTLHSDAHLRIKNDAGQMIGYDDQGQLVESGMPGSWLNIDGVEYLSLSLDNPAPYTVELVGINAGKFTLDAQVVRDGQATSFRYPEVPVQPGTLASFVLPPLPETAPLPVMQVNTGGVVSSVAAQELGRGVELENILLDKEPAPGSTGPQLPGLPDKISPSLVTGGMLAVGGLCLCGLALVGGGGLFWWLRRAKKTAPAGRRQASAAPQPVPVQPPVPVQLRVARGKASQALFVVPAGGVTIGTDPAVCGLVVHDSSASLQHARLQWLKGHWVLSDLRSSAGTYVNGQRIQQAVMHAGYQIQIGGCLLVIERAAPR